MSTEPLVTLEQAKDQLRITHDLEDDQIELQMAAATEQAYAYLGIDPDETEWDEDSAPDRVKGCILELLTNSYFRRGDQDGAEKSAERSEAILRKWLYQMRDPALA